MKLTKVLRSRSSGNPRPCNRKCFLKKGKSSKAAFPLVISPCSLFLTWFHKARASHHSVQLQSCELVRFLDPFEEGCLLHRSLCPIFQSHVHSNSLNLWNTSSDTYHSDLRIKRILCRFYYVVSYILSSFIYFAWSFAWNYKRTLRI